MDRMSAVNSNLGGGGGLLGQDFCLGAEDYKTE